MGYQALAPMRLCIFSQYLRDVTELKSVVTRKQYTITELMNWYNATCKDITSTSAALVNMMPTYTVRLRGIDIMVLPKPKDKLGLYRMGVFVMVKKSTEPLQI